MKEGKIPQSCWIREKKAKFTRDSCESERGEQGGWGGKVRGSDPRPAGYSLTCQSQKAELPACVPIWGPSGAQATHSRSWKRHECTCAGREEVSHCFRSDCVSGRPAGAVVVIQHGDLVHLLYTASMLHAYALVNCLQMPMSGREVCCEVKAQLTCKTAKI